MSDLSVRNAPAAPVKPTDIWSQMDRLFDSLRREFFTQFEPLPGTWGTFWNEPIAPALADVEDKGDHFEIRADLPGVPKEKIDIRVQGNVVRVNAEHASETKEDGTSYLRRERTYSGFSRVFELPEPVVGENVSAEYRDGVLHVSIPKAHPITEKKIPVA